MSNPLDWVASPVFNILDTASNIPGLDQTGLNEWLWNSPVTQGVRTFQEESPGGALAADIAAMFVPYVGWAGALGKAKLGATALGAVNRAGVAAASLAPRSPITAFALGETVRYAPLSAGITAFDLAGGRYENGMEALTSFGVGNALGAAGQAAGHALAPLVQRYAPTIIGGAWKSAFEPGPELAALYGFDNNIRNAARQTSRVPEVQEAASPLLEPQQRASALWDLINEADAGAHPDVDVNLLRSQYDTEIRTILTTELEPADTGFRFPRDSKDRTDERYTIDNLLRMAPNGVGTRVRVPLTGTGPTLANPDVLTGFMELPQGWLHDTELPGITQTTLSSAEALRQQTGLAGTHEAWRSLERVTPNGQSQIWSLRQEADNGSWLVVTELPAMGGEPHRMTGRARYGRTQSMDKAEPARAFLSFKTHNPSKFFPDMRADFDAPDPGVIGRMDDRIPRGRSDFLDKAMDFRRLYLSKETIRAGYESKIATQGGRSKLVEEMLAGPTMGKEIANFFETYTAPTDHQLKNSPEGRGILGLYQALFDAAEGRKNRLLHGMANIPEDKSPIAALFSPPNMDDANALVSNLRKLAQEDPSALEIIRKFDKVGDIPASSLSGTPVGKWLELALKVNDEEVTAINRGIEALKAAGATDAKTIPPRKNHFGLSRKWDGSNYYPIYREGAIDTDIVVAGGSREHAKQKAEAWIKAENESLAAAGKSPVNYRLGKPFTANDTDEINGKLLVKSLQPGLLQPRAGMRGYEHEHEPYKHLDDFIAELDEAYTQRWRYAASTIADALTTGKMNQLRYNDPTAFKILQTRIGQLKGQPGPIEQRLNQIVDSVAAPYVGTRSLSKAADGINELNFHLLHGVGNIATPLLNLTSVLQTQLPEAVNFVTSNPEVLRGSAYQIPVFGADGMPRAGMHTLPDPIGLLWGGVRRAMNPTEEDKEIFQLLFNRKEMGAGLANEYTGQDRTIAARMSEGIRGPEDLAHWAKTFSSFLMSKTEQISRTLSAGMSLDAMAKFEAINGVKFTTEQKLANALRFVKRTNYGYFAADRPMMYTSPIGSVFGNQKTWMTNYLFMMAEYTGLATKGNVWPLLLSLGTTTMLGGVFAVPMIGAGIDAFTETFMDKDATEYIFEQMGTGGNAISFGLPAMLGMSLSGNVAAPGSNLAHDTEFFFTIVALERAKLMGRAVGRAWDDQMVLGMNPLQDELFRKQATQAFAPRAVYRTAEAIMDESLRSAATGYPLIQEFGWGSRLMHSLGFRTTDIAVQYAAYESLLRDRDSMRSKISMFGEAYAVASLNNDRGEMNRLLQRAALSGLDISSVMRSAQVRMRAEGKDMFGRNFTGEQLERYQDTLRAGGRNERN